MKIEVQQEDYIQVVEVRSDYQRAEDEFYTQWAEDIEQE